MLQKYVCYIILSLILVFNHKVMGQEEIKTLEIGAKAPDFTLMGIDGNNYSLDSFSHAQVLTIIFTANHCPTAQAYEDRIKKLVDEYTDKGVAVVAISSNNPQALRLDEMGYTDLGDSMEEMKIRAKDKGFNFPYLYDGDYQIVAKKFGAKATPHVFIFNKDRILCYQGRFDNSEKIENVTIHDTRNAIDDLLSGQEVAVKETKTFGCSIKWAYKKKSVEDAIKKWNKEPVTVEMINLGDVRGLIKNDSDNLRLINIWATWCGPCIVEFPELIEIYRMYRNREFEIITLSIDDPSVDEKVLEFLKKNFASTKNYHYELDDKYKLIESVDKDWPGPIPYTLLIKPGGEIIYRKLGMIDSFEIKRAIISYLGRYYK